MATINKALADQIIANDGYYADDPRVHRVVTYTDMGGKLAYAIEYGHQIGEYAESPFVRDPKVIWEAK